MIQRIEYLGDCPHYLETLAAWHDHQWRHLNDPSYTLTKRCEEYRRECGRSVPFMLVAHDGQSPLGSVRVIEHDMDHHSQWSPWLASLYVHHGVRHCGIGQSLVQEACDKSRALGTEKLYLFSEVPDYFLKLGWKRLQEESYHGSRVSILFLPL